MSNDEQLSSIRDDVGASVPRSSVHVWDAAIRIFHWSLVALVVTAWITGGTGNRLHEIVGYAVAGLVAFRIVWGFVGTRHARFRNFVRGPSSVTGYLAGIARLRPAHYTGHNPAGAMMILALLVVLLTIVITGVMMQSNRFFGVAWVEQVHTLAANSLLLLVPLHVLGALIASLVHQENLIGAMFSGRKRMLPQTRATTSARERLEFRLKGAEGLFVLAILAGGGAVYGWISTVGQVPTAVPTIGMVSETAVAQTSARAVPATVPTPPPAPDLTPANATTAAEPTPTPAQAAVAVPSRPPMQMIDLQDYMTGGPEEPSQLWVLASGGRLYDRWYAALGKKPPTTNHPSWPTENINLKGAATWRCTSCHGWDYLGRDGHLKSGFGATGIRGLQRVRGLSVEDIVTILENNTHRFSDDLIPGHAKRRLAAFVSQGQHVTAQFIQPTGEVKGNAVIGRNLFQTLCAACHGFDGKARKLGISANPSYLGKPLYVGTKSRDGPLEVLHKIRNGHPGAPMISLRSLPMQSAADVLAYTRQLPAE